jgi:hypothetical protein
VKTPLPSEITSDVRHLCLSETGTGRAHAGSTKCFPTALASQQPWFPPTAVAHLDPDAAVASAGFDDPHVAAELRPPLARLGLVERRCMRLESGGALPREDGLSLSLQTLQEPGGCKGCVKQAGWGRTRTRLPPALNTNVVGMMVFTSTPLLLAYACKLLPSPAANAAPQSTCTHTTMKCAACIMCRVAERAADSAWACRGTSLAVSPSAMVHARAESREHSQRERRLGAELLVVPYPIHELARARLHHFVEVEALPIGPPPKVESAALRRRVRVRARVRVR